MRSRGERGSAIVELSLAIPLIVSLSLGVFQFGYAYYIYNQLEQAVRAGARYASVQTFDGTSGGWDDIVQRTRNVVIYGDPNPPGGATRIVRDVQPANVAVTADTETGRPGTVQVQIRNYSVGTFWSLVPDNKPATRFPYLGIYTGS